MEIYWPTSPIKWWAEPIINPKTFKPIRLKSARKYTSLPLPTIDDVELDAYSPSVNRRTCKWLKTHTSELDLKRREVIKPLHIVVEDVVVEKVPIVVEDIVVDGGSQVVLWYEKGVRVEQSKL